MFKLCYTIVLLALTVKAIRGIPNSIENSKGAQPAKCPNVKPIETLDQDEFEGRWYLIERLPIVFVNNQICYYVDNIKNSDGGFDVEGRGFLNKTEFNLNDWDDVWRNIDGTKFNSADKNLLSVMTVDFSGTKYFDKDKVLLSNETQLYVDDNTTVTIGELLLELPTTHSNYKILDIDEENFDYYLGYMCDEEGSKSLPPGTEYAYIWSRSKQLDPEIINDLKKKLLSFSNPDKSYNWIEIDQNCEDYD